MAPSPTPTISAVFQTVFHLHTSPTLHSQTEACQQHSTSPIMSILLISVPFNSPYYDLNTV